MFCPHSGSRKSPLRSMSPMHTTTTLPSNSGGREVTVEKYVSTGPAGTASGIPGLEMLDKELADVSIYFKFFLFFYISSALVFLLIVFDWFDFDDSIVLQVVLFSKIYV